MGEREGRGDQEGMEKGVRVVFKNSNLEDHCGVG